ncbi:hypothetical protein INT47_009945, partial [Mucor saturninus]
KPGPKPGSKTDPHAPRPGPKRLMDLPGLTQKRLDRMAIFNTGSATSSRMQEDREAYASTSDNVNGIILSNTIMDQNMEEDVGTLDELILDVATMKDDIVEGTESDAEE